MNRNVIAVICLVVLVTTIYESSTAVSKGQLRIALKMVRNICQPKSGAKTASIDGIRKGKFPKDEKLMVYCECVLGLMKVMKDSKFDPDGGLANLEKLPDELSVPLREGVKKCRHADKGTTRGCEAAYKVVECLHREIGKDFLFP